MAADDLDPDLRRELTKAQERIVQQLDAIEGRRQPHYRRFGGPPPLDEVEAELRAELAEIEELLGRGGSSQD